MPVPTVTAKPPATITIGQPIDLDDIFIFDTSKSQDIEGYAWRITDNSDDWDIIGGTPVKVNSGGKEVDQWEAKIYGDITQGFSGNSSFTSSNFSDLKLVFLKP